MGLGMRLHLLDPAFHVPVAESLCLCAKDSFSEFIPSFQGFPGFQGFLEMVQAGPVQRFYTRRGQR